MTAIESAANNQKPATSKVLTKEEKKEAEVKQAAPSVEAKETEIASASQPEARAVA